MSRLIALYSPSPQSGKSTFAHTAHNQEYAKLPFASPLKSMLWSLLHRVYSPEETHRILWGDLKAKPLPEFGGKTSGQLMQTLGTDWGRNTVSPNLWVNLWDLQARQLLDNGDNIITDDLRFPNEFKAVKDLGGITIKIIRPGYQSNDPRATNGHASEGLLEDHQFDMLMVNSGNKEDWDEYVTETLEYIKDNC